MAIAGDRQEADRGQPVQLDHSMSEVSSITMASVDEWREHEGVDLGPQLRLFQPPCPL